MAQINARISQTAMLKELTRENERLKAALGATHRQNGIYITPEQYEEYEEERVRLLVTGRSCRSHVLFILAWLSQMFFRCPVVGWAPPAASLRDRRR